MNRILILELTLIKDKYMVEKISMRCSLLVIRPGGLLQKNNGN